MRQLWWVTQCSLNSRILNRLPLITRFSMLLFGATILLSWLPLYLIIVISEIGWIRFASSQCVYGCAQVSICNAIYFIHHRNAIVFIIMRTAQEWIAYCCLPWFSHIKINSSFPLNSCSCFGTQLAASTQFGIKFINYVINLFSVDL